MHHITCQILELLHCHVVVCTTLRHVLVGKGISQQRLRAEESALSESL